MDLLRNLAVDLQFGPLNYEHQIPFPGEQRELLEDVLLSIHGHVANAHAFLLGPHDVRIYLDSVDATVAFVAELRAQLDLQNDDELRRGYAAALDAWLRMARALGGAYPPGDAAADAARAKELLAVKPFSALVDTLGNRGAGFSGFLHVFNFLYTAVPAPPVSLRKVIARVNEAAGKEVIGPLQPRVVTLSAGRCRLFHEDWAPEPVGGNVFVLAQFRYHNALLDRVVELEKRVDELEAFMEDGLQEILEAVGPDGDLQRALIQAREGTRDALAATKSLTAEVASQGSQLGALRAATQELRLAVDKL